MKTLNLIATIFFFCLALACTIAGAIDNNYFMLVLTFITFVIAVVAWKDYKKCLREEK